MINQTLVDFSGLAVVTAIVLYMVALIAFAGDLSGVAARRSDARLEEKERAQAELEQREKTAAVVGTGGGSVSVLERDEPAGAAPTTDESATAQRQPAQTKQGGLTARGFGFVVMAAAAVLHVAGMAMRGFAIGRVPWSNMYEFAMSGSAVVAVVFLVVAARRADLRLLGLFVVAPVLLTMLIAQVFWIVPAAILTPSLQNSHWLVIHVVVAVISTGLFTLGALMSVMQLIAARHQQAVMERGPHAWGRFGAVLDRLPNAKSLEAMAFRLHAVAFVGWTFTLIFGAIWAREAWGRYWGWDPKEVWTFVIWIVYAGYLHARATRGFRGNRAAWFALVGFLCLIFNFTIVNTVINGLHSYSGL